VAELGYGRLAAARERAAAAVVHDVAGDPQWVMAADGLPCFQMIEARGWKGVVKGG